MFKGANVLVTGGAGFIGSHLIERLLKEGCRVRATLHQHPSVINNLDVEYVTADLTVMEDCRRVVAGMDFVCHCAASTSGAAVMAKTPLMHMTPNIVMSAQLFDAAYMAKVKKFLYVSSSVVYPPSGDRPVREEDIFKGEPCEIYYGVGWMKRSAETLAIFYSQKLKNPMAVTVVRPANVFGPRDKFDPNTSHVTAALVRRVVQRENPFIVWGTGNDIRDLIYIDDFIDGLLLALRCRDLYLAVNLASGHGYTVKQVIQILLELDGFGNADVQFDSTKPQMIPIRLIDNTLACTKLGFSPSVGLHEGLRRTLAWYRQAGGVWRR